MPDTMLLSMAAVLLAVSACAQCPQKPARQHARDVDAWGGGGVAGPTVSPAFDCGARQMAFQFGAGRLGAAADLDALAAALALNATSSCARPAHDEAAVPGRPPAGPLGAEIYVSPGGSDGSGDGSRARPFRTPTRAAEAVAAAPKDGPVSVLLDPAVYAVPDGLLLGPQHGGSAAAPVTWTTTPASLREVGSGAGGSAVLSGAYRLAGLTWREAGDSPRAPIFRGRAAASPDEVAGLLAAGVPARGLSVLAAPGGTAAACRDACASRGDDCRSWSLWPRGAALGGRPLGSAVCVGRSSGEWAPTATQADGVACGTVSRVFEARVAPGTLPASVAVRSLYFNGTGAPRRLTLARFPNGNDTDPSLAGYVQADGGWPKSLHGTGSVVAANTTVLDSATGTRLSSGPTPAGGTLRVDAPPSEPLAHYPKGSCATFLAVRGGSLERFETGSGLVPFWDSAVCKGMFYQNDTFTPRSWSDPTEARVTMYQTDTWGNWGFTVSGRDEAHRSMGFAGGGFQEARGGGIKEAKSGSGPEGGGNRFFVDGVREELDGPGEFYFDREAGVLQLVPLDAAFAAALNSTEFWAPAASPVLGVRGAGHSSPASGMAFRGIGVTHSAEGFYDGVYEAPPGGDWALTRTGAVVLRNVADVVLDGVVVESPGGNGIVITDTATGINVTGCSVSDAGETGIIIVGTSALMDAYTVPTQPRRVTVERSHVHHVGRVGKQAAPIFLGIAEAITVRDNVFHSGPRAGINVNDPHGGGHTVQGNLVFNVVQSTWDHGPFNSWGREPFVYRSSRGGPPLLTPQQTTIEGNLMINRNYEPGHPNSDKLVDLDDGSTSYMSRGNVLVYGGQKFRDGRFRHCIGNLILFPETQDPKFGILPGLFLAPIGESVNANYTRSTDTFVNNTIAAVSGTFLSCTDGWEASNFPHMSNNTYLTPGNPELPFSVGKCCKSCGSLREWQAQGHDQGSTISSQVSDAELLASARAMLGL